MIQEHNSTVAPSLQQAPFSYQNPNQVVMNSFQTGTSLYGVKEIKITKIFTAVIVGFYICWSPFLITVSL